MAALSIVYTQGSTAEKDEIKSNKNHNDERVAGPNQEWPEISNINANMGAPDKVIAENDNTSKSIPGLVVIGSSFGGFLVLCLISLTIANIFKSRRRYQGV
ncbi:hypothetical protein DSO57_1037231 [Entomophthora muscae]|uniref:Uncharacterized protein n=1 Tax=Entomophthora muscae TaxID=34485 RepID=A0ACC2UJK9_9FUNG|nr:hypothetical protein DSO57_1037231 [Entomophthora muscae]